jgi:hypothetical protein
MNVATSTANRILASLALVVCAWSVRPALASPAPSRPRTRRARAVWRLRGCCLSPRTRGCEDDTARYLIGLARRGDAAVLGPMMDVASCGDPAIVSVLAPLFRDTLVARPRRFVRALAGRAEAVQRDAVYLAMTNAGDDVAPEDVARLKRTLDELGRGRGRFGLAARRCLAEVARATGDGGHE